MHFTGPLAYGDYKKVLQASTVHMYLTKPFVLSWSMLESMACGCTLVASDTPPVKEVVTHGVNGLLAPFFDTDKMAEQVETALDDATLRQRLGRAARDTITERYDMQKLLPQHLRILEMACAGR